MHTFSTKNEATMQISMMMLALLSETDGAKYSITDATMAEFASQVVQTYDDKSGTLRYYICTEEIEASSVYELIGKLEEHRDDYSENLQALADDVFTQVRVWVDLDSGTILNGPVCEVPASILTDDMSDSEVVRAARAFTGN